jgi:hypothetical protein
MLFDLFRRGHAPIPDGEHLRHLAFIVPDEVEEFRQFFQKEDDLRLGMKLKLRVESTLCHCGRLHAGCRSECGKRRSSRYGSIPNDRSIHQK